MRKVKGLLVTFVLFLVFGAGAADAKTIEQLGEVRYANSTSYCGAQRDAVGGWVYFGVVAMNRHPIGTRIRVTKIYTPVGGQKLTSFYGKRDFVVKDRYGHGTELDFFSPSCDYTFNAWGRRNVEYRIVYTKKLTIKQVCARRTTKASKKRCLKENRAPKKTSRN